MSKAIGIFECIDCNRNLNRVGLSILKNFRTRIWIQKFWNRSELGFEKVTPATFAANIEKAYQEFCKSLLFAFKQWIPRGCRKNYLQCWEKECKTLYCSFFQVPAGTNSDRAIRPCFCGSGIKGRNNGEKLPISSTSCNPTTRHGAPPINLQAGLHASLACAAS